MKLTFYKYQGAGNDFVMIDNRTLVFSIETESIARLCHRHFGIGADGLILLQNGTETDFRMVYFNSDGNESTMCGNGGRCFVRFLSDLKLITGGLTFEAIDGLHEGILDNNQIQLQMVDVKTVEISGETVFLNTGSPHHIEYVENVDAVNVNQKGSDIRYSEKYTPNGTNVNFVESISDNQLKIRTYERGVENETLACGTGVTAAAIAQFATGKTKSKQIELKAVGGDLLVKFEPNQNGEFTQVWLIGPAQKVFEGVIEV